MAKDFKLIKSFKPEGHAYFMDSRGRVYVVDNSGTNPMDTDDGPLIVDFQGELQFDKVRIPLKGGKATLASGDELEWIQNEFKRRIISRED